MKLAVLLSLCLYATSSLAEEAQFFRYTDQNGETVITQTLPPEASRLGYDVVAPNGQVIKHMPPPKTPEELKKEKDLEALKEKEKQLAEEHQKQLEMQSKKDALLFELFTSKEDIMRSRDEKIEANDSLIRFTQDNIARQTKQLEDAKTQIKELNQANKPIPKTLDIFVNETQKNIEANNTYLTQKQQEKQNIYTQYQDFLNRFEKIQEQ